MIPVPKDQRSIFVVPWGDRIYIGTTDTDYDGPLDDPQCTPEDVDYLLARSTSRVAEPLTDDDVLGTWAGLRPLVQGDAERAHRRPVAPPRGRPLGQRRRHRHRRQAHDLPADGGRHRRRRRRARSAEAAGRDGRSRTKHLPLRGAADGCDGGRGSAATERADHLAGRYGGEARVVLGMIDADPTSPSRWSPGLPYLRAEAVYAARYEMARTLDDVLARRTRARLLGRDAAAAAAADVAGCSRRSWAGREAEQAAQVEPYVPRSPSRAVERPTVARCVGA